MDWVPNYDGTEMIPAVMPTKVPNLLVNGSSGIAVGMATNIPPEKTEIVNGCLALIENGDLTIDELMTHPPDFPPAASSTAVPASMQAYRTGRRPHLYAAKASRWKGRKTVARPSSSTRSPIRGTEGSPDREDRRAGQREEDRGISALRDRVRQGRHAHRHGIELRRGEVGGCAGSTTCISIPRCRNGSASTWLRWTTQPEDVNLKDRSWTAFLLHRREVVTRRTVFELRKARDRAHILEGLAVALANIDPVIELIRHSADPADTKSRPGAAGAGELGNVAAMLEKRATDVGRVAGARSSVSAKAVFPDRTTGPGHPDLRLQKLTGLEHEKILEEAKLCWIRLPSCCTSHSPAV